MKEGILVEKKKIDGKIELEMMGYEFNSSLLASSKEDQ
jgi:hypothetical protein